MYTYAFMQGSAIPLDLPEGMAGSLQVVTTSELAAVVESGLNFESFQQSDERLMQAVLIHDRVIRDLFSQTTILPLQFGTRFVSKDALLLHLQAQSTEYVNKLNSLVDKAEYMIKLTPVNLTEEEDLSVDLKGKDYFLAKKQRYQNQMDLKQKRRAEMEQVQEAIATVYSNVVHSNSQDGVERFYLLTRRLEETFLLEKLQTWQTKCTHWHLEVGEALPPYHFV
jgi:hypothetical protein